MKILIHWAIFFSKLGGCPEIEDTPSHQKKKKNKPLRGIPPWAACPSCYDDIRVKKKYVIFVEKT